MRLIVLALMLSLFGVGCTTLRPDRVEYALKAKYDTLEMTGCGNYFYASGDCKVEKYTPIKSLNLTVYTYYKGKVVIDGCGVNISKQYENSGSIIIDSDIPVTKDCVMSITMSPELPKQSDSPVVVGSWRGHIYLIVKEPVVQQFKFSQASLVGDNPEFVMPLNGELEANVVVVGSGDGGCDVSYSKRHLSQDGFLRIPLRDILPAPDAPRRCVLQGIVSTPSEDMQIIWAVNNYSSKFIPLAEPAVSLKDNKLCVTADENATLVLIQNGYKVSNKYCRKLDMAKPIVVRTLTAGGRSAIGIYNTTSKTWKWYH